MWSRTLIALLTATCSVGCSTTELVSPSATGTISADADTDGQALTQDIAGSPNGDGQGSGASGNNEDTWQAPTEGGFGWPCTTQDDCNSGWCIVTPEGKVCTKTCESECPEGWRCMQLVAGDPVFLCLPRWLHLCDPCTKHEHCRQSEADPGHYCLDWGPMGKFCGGECNSDGQCPSGYSCQDVPIGNGQLQPQCVPDSQQCRCSPLAIELALETTCALSNDEGVCIGSRQCTPNGLNECDAPTPLAEQCNGLDDDCDEAVDNLPPDYTCAVQNEHGTCLGSGICIGGVEVCDAPNPVPETCNGIDDNCDGQTDEGSPNTDLDALANCVDDDDDNDGIGDIDDNCPTEPNEDQIDTDGDTLGDACDPDDDNDSVPDAEDCEPLDATINPGALEACDGIDNDCNDLIDDNLCNDGNPCTIDACNADGSCANQADNTQLCDDGSVCTQVDKCIDGVCSGLNPISCDDFDDCTEDSCDPVAACLHSPTNGNDCEDGSPCTENDICVNGSCNPGTVVDCTDGNPCIFSTCNPQIGCAPPQPINGAACVLSNGGECPTGTCAGGSCIPKAGITCQTEVSLDPFGLCEEDVAGTCTGTGECVVDANDIPSCPCGGTSCSSICTCLCGFPICLDFLF